MIVNILPLEKIKEAGKFAMIIFDRDATEGVKLVVDGVTADEIRDALNERHFSVSWISLDDKAATQNV